MRASNFNHPSASLSTRIAMPSSPPDRQYNQDNLRRTQYQPDYQSGGQQTYSRYSPPRATIRSTHLSRDAHQGRVPSKTFQVRLTRRQIVLLLGSLLTIIVVLRQQSHRNAAGTSSTDKSSNTARSRRNPSFSSDNVKGRRPFTPQGIPIVDRDILRERIRKIEAEGGWIDEDVDEARSAGRLPMRYSPGRPAVLSIPDGKPRNRPKLTDQDVEAYRLAHLQDTELLDKEYCPDQFEGCKFLLPAWIGEQETKAQMHLYQLGLLSIALNRTLVLPNVSKSRMMTCGSQRFGFYYDNDALKDLGIPSIISQRFSEWSSRRRLLPTAQIIAIANSNTDYSAGALEVDSHADPSSIPALPKRKLCLEAPRAHLNFTQYSPVTVYPPANWHKQNEDRYHFGESLINTLKSLRVQQQSYRSIDTRGRLLRWFSFSSAKKSEDPPVPDVLVFNYELRYPILHHERVQYLSRQPNQIMSHANINNVQDFRHFAYSKIWTGLAEQMIDKLSPFIAIHWRQETLPSSIIAPCAVALIDKLEALLRDRDGSMDRQKYAGIRTIYLATDYPIEDLTDGVSGAIAHSGTFGKLLTEEHHTAMRDFLQMFQERISEPLGVRLTSFSSEQASLKISDDLLRAVAPPTPMLTNNGRPRRKSPPKLPPSGLNLAELDVGLLGIIDKTVAMGAEIFLTGQPWSSDKNVQATVCAKESSFTKQISEARRLRRVRDSVSREAAGLAGSTQDITKQLWSERQFLVCAQGVLS